jgi:hypothetical protein
MSDNQIQGNPLPQENPVPENPGTVQPQRDLAAERDAEMARERAAVKAREDRFTVKKFTAVNKPAPPSAPEYETLILKAAVNHAFQDLTYPTVSTFVPNLSAFYLILTYMDHLMCNTRKWTENCFGWAPPLSQMYFSVLIYFQIFRAMDAAGVASSDMLIFLEQFERTFPLSELWIPGPLVNAFRSLSAFRPDALDLFAGTTVNTPTSPGWTTDNYYRLETNIAFLLPNISLYLSRLRAICTVALTATSEMNFLADINGPRKCQNFFGAQVSNTAAFTTLFHTPGLAFAYGGSQLLWQNAARALDINSIPADFVHATPSPIRDSWTNFIRFENHEHTWFATVSAMMAKYSQFWNGSTSLADINPVSSAAGAVKMRQTTDTTIYATPTFVDAVTGPPAVPAHFVLRTDARFVNDAQIALRDIPDAHAFSAITFGFNSYHSRASQDASRRGKFWLLGPDVKQAHSVEVLPGTLQTIAREYHRDTRLDAFRQ